MHACMHPYELFRALFSNGVMTPLRVGVHASDTLQNTASPESESRVIKSSVIDGDLSATTGVLKTQVNVTRPT